MQFGRVTDMFSKVMLLYTAVRYNTPINEKCFFFYVCTDVSCLGTGQSIEGLGPEHLKM